MFLVTSDEQCSIMIWFTNQTRHHVQLFIFLVYPDTSYVDCAVCFCPSPLLYDVFCFSFFIYLRNLVHESLRRRSIISDMSLSSSSIRVVAAISFLEIILSAIRESQNSSPSWDVPSWSNYIPTLTRKISKSSLVISLCTEAFKKYESGSSILNRCPGVGGCSLPD